MTAFILVAWLCAPRAPVCGPGHPALGIVRSAPMNKFVCVASLPRYLGPTRRVRVVTGCETVNPEI